jgi:amino acid permease
MARKSRSDAALVFSYLALRKAIGILGTALPFVLFLGGEAIFGNGIQSSLSYYYHTGMRDVFVGTLFAIGFFLLSYQGYEKADRIAGILACVFAVCVALFPTALHSSPAGPERTISAVHLASAAAFFCTLIFFSMYLFTKTNPRKKPTKQKLQRNNVYRSCGVIMAMCIVLTGIYAAFPEVQAALAGTQPIYWLESTAIVAFGISWLVKGEAILKDKG